MRRYDLRGRDPKPWRGAVRSILACTALRAHARRSRHDPGRRRRNISGEAPPGVPPGDYQAQLDVSEQKQKPRTKRRRLDLPLHHALWDDNISLRREDIYGDDGRYAQES